MIDPGTIRMLEETIESLVAKHNLSAYTTKPEPVSSKAATEILCLSVYHWEESPGTVLKKMILSRNMKTAYLTLLSLPDSLESFSLSVSDKIEQEFLEHLRQTAEVRNVTIPKSLVGALRKKEFVVDQISALVHEDFKGVASPPVIECVMSDNLENQICASSQFRIANFPKEAKRMTTDSMYVNISKHLEPMEVLVFAYEYTYFPRPQIKVAEGEEDNMLFVDVCIQRPTEPTVKPIRYVFS